MIADLEKLFFSKLAVDIERHDFVQEEVFTECDGNSGIHDIIDHELSERMKTPMNDGNTFYIHTGKNKYYFGSTMTNMAPVSEDKLLSIIQKHGGLCTEGLSEQSGVKNAYITILEGIVDSDTSDNPDEYSRIDLSSSCLLISQIINIAIRLFSLASEDTCMSIKMPDESYTVILTEQSQIPVIIGSAILLQKPDHILQDVLVYRDVVFDRLERDAQIYRFIGRPLPVKPRVLNLWVCQPDIGTIIIDKYRGKHLIEQLGRDFLTPDVMENLPEEQQQTVLQALEEGRCSQTTKENSLVIAGTDGQLWCADKEYLTALGVQAHEFEMAQPEKEISWVEAKSYKNAEFEKPAIAHLIFPEQLKKLEEYMLMQTESKDKDINISKEDPSDKISDENKDTLDDSLREDNEVKDKFHQENNNIIHIEVGEHSFDIDKNAFEKGCALLIHDNELNMRDTMDIKEFFDMYMDYGKDDIVNEIITENVPELVVTKEAPYPDRDMFSKEDHPQTLAYDLEEVMGQPHHEETHEYELINLSKELREVEERQRLKKEAEQNKDDKTKFRGRGGHSSNNSRQEKKQNIQKGDER